MGRHCEEAYRPTWQSRFKNMRYYLLYDEDCALCLRFQKAIKEMDSAGRIEPVGFHDRRIPEIVPHLKPEELVNNFHLVFPDGSVKSGSQALPDLLSLLPSLRFVGWILKTVPGTQKFSDLIYRWISKARQAEAPEGP